LHYFSPSVTIGMSFLVICITYFENIILITVSTEKNHSLSSSSSPFDMMYSKCCICDY